MSILSGDGRGWFCVLIPSVFISPTKHFFLLVVMCEQEYITKERREYQTLLYHALNICGESRIWNANNRHTSPFTYSVMTITYLEMVVE